MASQKRLARSRVARRLGCESLEARQMLTGDHAVGVEPSVGILQANGRSGYWNGRFESATVYGGPAIPPELLPLPTWTSLSLGEGFFTLYAPDADPQLVLDWAAATPGVLAIEPDLYVEAPFGFAPAGAPATDSVDPVAIPNDPDYPLQWAPPTIEAPLAWAATIGTRNVIVAVLDSGIDLVHPDLTGNVWTNPREIPNNGIDDEKNGFIDDVVGWNFIDDTSDTQDRFGHGTHVSGIIGAVGNNGLGVAGLNWQVSIMPLKIIADNGVGTVSAALAAMSYVSMMRRDFETNVVVSNNSWGAVLGSSVVMRDAIVAMNDLGIGFVAAAGNSASDNDIIPRYPSGYDVPNVIAVASSDTTDQLSLFSNYGGESVDLAAPGSGIYSTLSGGGYGYLSGTSMAAPQVSGAYALVASAKSSLTVSEIRDAILGSTDPVPELLGKTVTGGRLNITGALKSLGLLPVTPPDPPPPPPPPIPADQPFADDFNQPNAPTLSGYWATRLGAIGTVNEEAVGSAAGVSIVTLNGVSTVDSVSQTFVNVRSGTSVGLVARYTGAGDRNMYVASIARTDGSFVGRIWRNLGGTWRALAGGPVTSGAGVLRFEVAGSSLTLLFNGIRIAGAYDTAITNAGAVGIRMTLPGASCDNYAQDTLVAPARVAAVLPYSNTFTAIDNPYVPEAWSKRFGNLAQASNVVVSRIDGVSLMALNDVAVRDSRSQAFVNLVNGKAVTLVARYTGAADSRMYSAGLVRTASGFAGLIWLNRGTGWTLLASGTSPGGSGVIRFDVVGTALTLYLNGKKIAATSNRAITGGGTMGIRFVGAGSVADNYQAISLTPPPPVTPTSPFGDAFIRPDSPFISSYWDQPFGNVVLADDRVVSQYDGPSIARLHGISVLNSSTQAVVNISSGTRVGLVARYRGDADRCMYLGGLVRRGDTYHGEIWRNDARGWSLLACARVAGGSGRIRFDCIGSSLTLYLNGNRIAAARDTVLNQPGSVGLRLMGDGAKAESYAYERR